MREFQTSPQFTKTIFRQILMTALLALIAANPYFQREHILGGLSELRALGTITSVLLIIAFFIAIAFYCRTL